jgi:hypothetical protein
VLAHAVLQIGGNTHIELFRFVDDVNVPIAHRVFVRDRLPSRSELVLLRQAQDKFAIRRRTSSQPVLAETGGSEINEGQTSFARPVAGSG